MPFGVGSFGSAALPANTPPLPPPDNGSSFLSDIGGALNPIGGLVGGLANALGSGPSGVVDNGITDASQTNIVGNINPDFAEILREINSSSATTGGHPTFIPSPFATMGSGAVSVTAPIPTRSGGGLNPLLILGVVGGVGALFFLRRGA